MPRAEALHHPRTSDVWSVLDALVEGVAPVAEQFNANPRSRCPHRRRHQRSFVEEHNALADAYWRYYRLTVGSRKERLAAEEVSWARDAVWDAVHTAPMPVVLALVDQLLAHPSADAAHVGAGPVEDILHLDEVEDWDEELTRRCEASAAWREAVGSAVWPGTLSLPRHRPYLRAPVREAPSPAQGRSRKRRQGRDVGQGHRPQPR